MAVSTLFPEMHLKGQFSDNVPSPSQPSLPTLLRIQREGLTSALRGAVARTHCGPVGGPLWPPHPPGLPAVEAAVLSGMPWLNGSSCLWLEANVPGL